MGGDGGLTRAEIVRLAHDSFEINDLSRLLPHIAPDAEITSSFVGLGAVVYRGPDGVEQMLAEVEEAFGARQSNLLEIRQLGDDLLINHELTLHGQQSGMVVIGELLQVYSFDADDRIVRFRGVGKPTPALLRELRWEDAEPLAVPERMF